MNIPKEIIEQVKQAEESRHNEEVKKANDWSNEFLDYIFKESGFHTLPAAFGIRQNDKKGFGIKPYRLHAKGFNLQIYPVYSQSDQSYAVCFDMNRIAPGDVVKLVVPYGKEGLFVGYSGKHVKRWCRQLSLMRIDVVPIAKKEPQN